MYAKCILSILAAIIALSSVGLVGLVSAVPDQIKDYKELLTLTQQLEAADTSLSGSPKERDKLVYSLVKADKAAICAKQREQGFKVANEYKIKAYNLIEESKKKKNWFSSAFGNLVGPISKLRGLSKFDPSLIAITDRYKVQSESGLLRESDVDCDMSKFKVKTMHEIMLILQTEVKYLLTESLYSINRAIYDKLKSDGFVSRSNFYDTHKLNENQRALLLQFITERMDTQKVTIIEAEDRYYKPSEYVVGRLLESCQILSKYNNVLVEVTEENKNSCKDSESGPLGSLFGQQFLANRFESIAHFCDQFFNSL